VSDPVPAHPDAVRRHPHDSTHPSPWRRLRDRLSRGSHRPVLPPSPEASWWASKVLPERVLERAAQARYEDQGNGFDPFGMHPGGVAAGLAINHWLYERWFRVRSTGTEHIPANGPVVLAANHSGTIPLDSFMIWTDIVRKGPAHRVPRVVMDHFVPSLPLLSTVFSRAGAIGGSRGNVHAVLDRGEMLLVHPEGVPGIGKPFSRRYQLQTWRPGHAELAIRHHAPVVPIAVIGAEEQMPQVARIPWIHAFGAPYLPITATLFPLPVRYHIWYGEPLAIHEQFEPALADDPEVVAQATAMVKGAVQDLIAQGLKARRSIFR
jgi:1-acyl-sn-glycerol-3-phosphate acyltransferase